MFSRLGNWDGGRAVATQGFSEGGCQGDCLMEAIHDRQTSWIIICVSNGVRITEDNTCKGAIVATAAIP